MGKMVHVVSRQAEYGSREAFNWQYEEFSDFLGNLGCDVCNKEDVFDEFECAIEDYKRALSLLKDYKKYGRCKRVENKFNEADADIDSVEKGLEVLGGLDNVLDDMQAFYNQRDKKHDWISFSAW